MRRLSDAVKIDYAIQPRATTNVTSPYFSMADYSRALFVFTVEDTVGNLLTAGTTADTTLTTSIGTILQATSITGANSAGLAGSTAIASHNKRVVSFSVGLGLAVAEGTTISITGYNPITGSANTALTYTATGNGTAAKSAGRYFSLAGPTAGATANVSSMATDLAAILNDATYGVPGAVATAFTATVTLAAKDGGTALTFTASTTTTLTVSSSKIMGICEVNASSLTLSSSFTHVAIQVTNQTGNVTSAILIRSGCRQQMPHQMVTIATVGE